MPHLYCHCHVICPHQPIVSPGLTNATADNVPDILLPLLTKTLFAPVCVRPWVSGVFVSAAQLGAS